MQSEAGVIHVIADRMEDWTPSLGQLSAEGREIETLARADEVRRPQLSMAQKRQGNRFAQVQLFADSRTAAPVVEEREAARAMPAGRNFH